MEIHKSAEDYLETILQLHQKQGLVRSIDVVAALQFSKPSVSVAMKKLRESGHVEMSPEGFLTLTPKGYDVASRILERHEVLTEMLTMLGVDPQEAAEEACQIEHVITDNTFALLKAHLRHGLDACPQPSPQDD